MEVGVRSLPDYGMAVCLCEIDRRKLLTINEK